MERRHGKQISLLRFTVTCNPTLAAQEHDVFMTAFITSDAHAKPELILVSAKELSKNNMTANVEFSLDSEVELLDDTSICIQMFCHLENHKGEKCAHRCGFSAFALKGMAAAMMANRGGEVAKFYDTARDHGVGRDGRGMVSIIPDRIITTLKFAQRGNADTIVMKAGNGTLSSWLGAMRTYHGAFHEAIPSGGDVDPGVRVKALPMYILSGGMMLPSCAFLLARAPPKASEEYYLNALRIVTERRYPWLGISQGPRWLQEVISGLGVDEQGSLLLEMALLLPTTCPYLFDTAIAGTRESGFRLWNTDEFSRLCRLVKCGDCEDGSLEAAMVLWDILTASSGPGGGRWTTGVMELMREIRRRYVVVVTLKAVTRPSQQQVSEPSTPTKNKEGGCSCGGKGGVASYAAHACCDMVPLWWLTQLLASGKAGKDSIEVLAMRELAKERGTKVQPRRVIVGESTGVVTPFVETRDAAPRWARKVAREMFGISIPGVKVVCREDMTVGSTFYRYAMSGLVHDTLISPAVAALARAHGVEWLCPQVIYASKGDKTGILHTEYTACTGTASANPIRPPTMGEWNTIMSLEKFEHPIPHIACPAVDRERGRSADAMLRSRLTKAALAKEIPWGSPGFRDASMFTRDIRMKEGDESEWTMELSVSLSEMDGDAVESMSVELEGDNVAWFSMSDASVCDDVIGCTIAVRIKRMNG
jgi:hypothetical protein